MPLRMLIDGGAVAAGDVALVGARDLDPAEEGFIAAAASTPASAVSSRPSPGRRGSTSRSTRTCSSPASRGVLARGRRPDARRAEKLLGHVRDLAPCSAPGSPGSAPTSGTSIRSAASAPRSGCNPAARVGRSKIAEVAAHIDVSIEHGTPPEAGGGKRHPNTCPACGSHYRDDELERHLWVCPHCGHHFPMPAARGSRQLADGGSFVEDAAEVRSADPLGFFDLRPYPERLAEAELNTGLGDAIVIGGAAIEGERVRARRDGLLLHGRLDGQRRRREVLPRLRGGRRARRAARRGHGLRRRPHAGGDPRADADAEDGLRGRGPPRRGRRAVLVSPIRRPAACSRASRASAT